jgi:hypothetical protein
MSHIPFPLTVRFVGQTSRWKLIGHDFRMFPDVVVRTQPADLLSDFDIAGEAVWALRADFLTAQSPTAMLTFLCRTGPFSGRKEWPQSDLCGWQQIIRKLMTRSRRRWSALALSDYAKEVIHRSRKMTIELWRSDGGAALVAFNTLEALLATVHVDQLRGARFKFCARPDCRRPFDLTSRHKRKYCSDECGHLMAVRAARARARQGSGRKQKLRAGSRRRRSAK